MPKYRVLLGRLVREVADIVVEAPDAASLEDNLREVYDAYDDPGWVPDDEWGCEPSDSHFVVGPADANDPVDVDLNEVLGDEDEEEDDVD